MTSTVIAARDLARWMLLAWAIILSVYAVVGIARFFLRLLDTGRTGESSLPDEPPDDDREDAA